MDAVTVFDEDSPAALIAAIRPDVHAKGTDYAADAVPERAVVAAYGGTDGDRRGSQGSRHDRPRGKDQGLQLTLTAHSQKAEKKAER